MTKSDEGRQLSYFAFPPASHLIRFNRKKITALPLAGRQLANPGEFFIFLSEKNKPFANTQYRGENLSETDR